MLGEERWGWGEGYSQPEPGILGFWVLVLKKYLVRRRKRVAGKYCKVGSLGPFKIKKKSHFFFLASRIVEEEQKKSRERNLRAFGWLPSACRHQPVAIGLSSSNRS